MAEEVKPPCPRCRTNEYIVPLLYSLKLSGNISEILASGAFLGGCNVHPGSPKWHCSNCGTDFGHLEEDEVKS